MSARRAHPLTTYSATMVERLTSTARFDGECVPCQQRAGYAEEPAEPSEGDQTPSAQGFWEGPIGIEGELTGDGRMIALDALRWEDFPLPIRDAPEDNGAHDGAVDVGHIFGIERRKDGVIWAWGDWDLESEAGREAQRVVGNKVRHGVSMDLDDVDFEIRIAAEVAEEMDAFWDDLMGEGDDEPAEPEERPTDEEGRVTVVSVNSDDEVMVTTGARVRAVTLVSIPAFNRCRITNVDEAPEALVASGGYSRPPKEWFQNPRLTEVTPLHVGEDGRVYGHLAAWGTCHISHAHRGCITPPHSATGYRDFLHGSVLTADGTEVRVGQIVMETGHANIRLTAQNAMEHYDNTGLAAADIAVGEDAYGIWVAGAVRPSLSEEKRAVLRAHPLSGDWRQQGGSQELVAALAVSVPGYPIPRPAGRVSGGEVLALVASGMVPPEALRHSEEESVPLSMEDVRYLHRLLDRQRAADKEQALALKRRVQGSRLALAAHKIKGERTA